MRLDEKSGRHRKWIGAFICGVVVVFLILFLMQVGHHGDTDSGPGIVVLDDRDKDFRKPPFEDAATLFTRTGKALWSVRHFNICETVGGCRAVAAAPNGRCVIVSETVGRTLSSFDAQTGRQRWVLNGGYTAAVVSPEEVTYALISSGPIYGDKIVAISKDGVIINEADLGGFDVVLDPERKALWLVGADIKKCDVDLHPILKLNSVGWCAVSVDVATNGSIWVAERHHPDVSASRDRLLNIAATGEMSKTIDLRFSPMCVRIDRTTDDIWVTGIKVTQSLWRKLLDRIEKLTGRLPLGNRLREILTRSAVSPVAVRFDKEGKQLVALKNGGNAIEVDPKDHSIWIVTRTKVVSNRLPRARQHLPTRLLA